MSQQIWILGWLDPDMPARWKGSSQYEFRLKLSETPSSSWKKSFSDQGRSQASSEPIEHDVITLSCDLDEIEAAIERIKLRIEQTNKAVSRLEAEMDDRAAAQRQVEAEKSRKILAAVANIRFTPPDPAIAD